MTDRINLNELRESTQRIGVSAPNYGKRITIPNVRIDSDTLLTLIDLAEAACRESDAIIVLATGPWGNGEGGEPTRKAVQVRHEHFANHARRIREALARFDFDT
jgi:hypothetical protein